MRRTLALTVVLPAWLGQAPGDDRADPAVKARREKLTGLDQGEAAGHVIFRDAGREEKIEGDVP